MKKLLVKISILIGIVAVPLLLCLFFLPDPKSRKGLDGALIDKHILLEKSKPATIILIGGSNAGMGFKTQIMKDSLKLPVINAAVSGWFGLKFIINDVKTYIKKNDLIVLCVPYTSFENTTDNDFIGNSLLVPVLFDVSPKAIINLDYPEFKRIAPFIAPYILAKIKQVFIKDEFDGIYRRDGFNQDGDFTAHYSLIRTLKLKPQPKCLGSEGLNSKVIPFLVNFNQYVIAKGATFVILPPSIQSASFNNQVFIINKIDSALKVNNLAFISPTLRYKFEDRYLYDFIYHLNSEGAELNTRLAITDLLKVKAVKKMKSDDTIQRQFHIHRVQ